MQRKCKTCGAIAFVGYSDPWRRESWLAPACDVHHAQIERAWLQWLHDNGRRVLPPEYRHQDNRSLDFGAVTQGNRQEPAQPVSAQAPEPKQGALF